LLAGIPVSFLRSAGQASSASSIRPAGSMRRDTSGQKSTPASIKAQATVPAKAAP